MTHELSISKWGPAAWRFLHSVSFTYKINPSNEDKHNMYNFLKYFSRVIPCKKCRDDFSRYTEKTLSENSKHLNSREELVSYINQAHNYVNKKSSKKQFTLEECKEKYLTVETNTRYYVILILVLAIIYFCYMRIKKKNN